MLLAPQTENYNKYLMLKKLCGMPTLSWSPQPFLVLCAEQLFAKRAGADVLPPGHGCHSLYYDFCVADMDHRYCPRILGNKSSLYGVAMSLENDDVKWVGTVRTCKSAR